MHLTAEQLAAELQNFARQIGPRASISAVIDSHSTHNCAAIIYANGPGHAGHHISCQNFAEMQDKIAAYITKERERATAADREYASWECV